MGVGLISWAHIFGDYRRVVRRLTIARIVRKETTMYPTRTSSAPFARHAMAYVLAGGRGTRLMELTDRRAKPAVYFGGKLRIIDFALSNALNSGIRSTRRTA
jgi:hypothetical protein